MRALIRWGVVFATWLGVAGFVPQVLADAGSPDAGDGGAPSTMTPGAILAYYCGDAEMRCMMAPLEFDYTHSLAPWAPKWDTGWIPSSPDLLQVRFVLKLPMDTQVSMGGKFYTTWPDALTMSAPGERFSGFLKIDYGLVMSGRFKIHIGSPLNFDWEDDIPYVPNIDFHLLGMKQFDPWAFPPDAAQVSAFTPRFTLFSINLLALAKIPKDVLAGGVALDISGEMRATYETEKMMIVPNTEPLTSSEASAHHDFVGGSFVEVDVYPDGKMDYDGLIHLVPVLWIKIAGGAFGSPSIPLHDFAINITDLLNLDLASKVPFNKVRVHVPLPDIAPFEQTVIDFGSIPVGASEKQMFELTNIGEATARAVGEVNSSTKSVFTMPAPSTLIDPGESSELSVRFTPTKSGQFEGKLTIRSNDPDLPEQEVLMKGSEYDPDDPEGPNPKDGGPKPGKEGGPGSSSEWEPTLADGSVDDGGCACRMAQNGTPVGGTSAKQWMVLFGLAALGFARRGSCRRGVGAIRESASTLVKPGHRV